MQFVARQIGQYPALQRVFLFHQIIDLGQEPGIDLAGALNVLEAHTHAEGIGHVPEPLGAGIAHLGLDLVLVGGFLVQSIDTGFQAAQGLLQRLLEGAADGHDLAHRLHLGGQAIVRLGEFLEGETRHLGDHIVDGRLEGRRRCTTGDLVTQFVQGVADRQLWRHLGDRKAGGLRGQSGGTETRAGSSR
jgi:hypothetical protein